jgi:hypothetical protein
MNPVSVTISDEMEYAYMIRARCIGLFAEICDLADEGVFGHLTACIESVESADTLLADFTAARDALLRLTLEHRRTGGA